MVALTEQIVRGKTRLERLEEVKNLNLWGQDIDSLSVLTRMPNVEILSLSVNRINSLRDFRHCARLQELYLRKNFITDITDLQYLMPLAGLKVVTLLPSVEKLDNVEVTPQERDTARCDPEVLRFIERFPRPEDCEFATPPPAGGNDARTPMPQPQYVPQSPQYVTDTYQEEQGRYTPDMQYRNGQHPAPSAQHTPADVQHPAPGYVQRTASDMQAQYGNGGSPAPLPRPSSRTPAVEQPQTYAAMHRSPSAGLAGDPYQRRRKNILYAVMALVTELEGDDLLYVKREIEQRLGNAER